MSRQASLFTSIGQVHISETAARQAALPGIHLNETSSAIQNLTSASVSSNDAFYSPIALNSNSLTPGLFNDSVNDVFYVPIITAADTLLPGLVASDDAFYSATLTTSVGITAGLVSDSDTFYAPTIASADSLLPGLISSDDVVFSPTITTLGSITSASVSNDDVIYHPSMGANDPIVSAAYPADDIFYAPFMRLAQAVQPANFVFADVFYAPLVTNGKVLLPALFAPGDVIFTPAKVSLGILPGLFTDVDVIYSPVLVNNSTLHPPLVTSADVIQPGEVFFQIDIGNTGGGGSGGTLPADQKYASSIVVAQSGIITGLQINSTTAAPLVHARMGIYANGAGNKPTTLLAFSGILSGIVAGENTFPLTSPSAGLSVTAGEVIWIAINTDGTINWFLIAAAGGSKFNTNTFTGGLSNPFGTTSNDNQTAPVSAILLVGGASVSLLPGFIDDTVLTPEIIWLPSVATTNTLVASLVDDTVNDAVIAPVVSSLNMIQPQTSSYDNDDIIYAPTVSTLNTLTALLWVEADTFYIPIVSAFSPNIASVKFDSDDVIYTPTVTASGANLLAPYYDDSQNDIIYTPIMAGSYGVTAGLVDDSLGDVIYSPTVLSGSGIFVPFLDDTTFEFIWPPTVTIVGTNFALGSSLCIDAVETIWSPFVTNPAFPGAIPSGLIVSESDRLISLEAGE